VNAAGERPIVRITGRDVWIAFPTASATPFQRLTWLSIFHVPQGERATPAAM
jgi:hypothetical protein